MQVVRSVVRSLADRFRPKTVAAPEPAMPSAPEPAPAGDRDPLTGLQTLSEFESALRLAARRADLEKTQLALLCLPLDGFRSIDEDIGHSAGDRLLCAIAGRLRSFGSQPDRLTRLAGDEFVLLLDDDPQPRDAAELARQIIEAVEQPVAIDGRPRSLACSIGIAMYPEHGALSTMLAHAHAAMSNAEQAGGSSCVFFEQHMLRGPREDRDLLRDLRLALERAEFELFYQPKIHAPTGEVTGAEALMRWHHPTRGMISPAVFIPIAERYGLITDIGQWVIDRACRQARDWRDDGLRMRVAINLSVHQLRHPELPGRIADALQRHQVNPDLLTCEITESAAMSDIETTVRVLGELDRIGVHLSIDDFGTGHSSLAWLRKLPADELKIDRGFVMDLETSEDARTVALAIIRLAQALDLKVVAEGVETEAQNRILRDFGCDQLQGFLFAKPMSAATLSLWATDDAGPRTLAFRDSLFTETGPAPL